MKRLTIITTMLLYAGLSRAQDTLSTRVLTLKEVMELSEKNSTQLKVVEKNTELAKQKVEIAKLYQLPDLGAQLSHGYLSNTDIWTPSFDEHQKGKNPHQFAQFTIQASQVLFAGGKISNEIKKTDIEAQVAFLLQEKNTQDIKFLAAAQYLDIYRMINLRQVYASNAKLAEERLKNIQVMRKQGMVTENDVLRSKLILSDLNLSVRKTENNIAILNRQLNMLTGRPDNASLLPDSAMLKNFPAAGSLEGWLDTALNRNHELKISAKENRVAEANVKIAGADRYPALAAFAGSNLQRPFTYTIPSVDVYYNVWQAGLTLKYNISSIYQAPRKIRAAKLAAEQSIQKETLQKQQVNVEVSSRFIKYREADDERQTLESDLKAAEENYRIVEKKYFNQLALLTDLVDATSTKIEAEIRVSTARINMVYTYLQLQKSVGTL